VEPLHGPGGATVRREGVIQTRMRADEALSASITSKNVRCAEIELMPPARQGGEPQALTADEVFELDVDPQDEVVGLHRV
jgi:hypothetical protein